MAIGSLWSFSWVPQASPWLLAILQYHGTTSTTSTLIKLFLEIFFKK
jgi:hypothetical protein